MFNESNLFWFGCLLWLGSTALVLSFVGSKSKDKSDLSTSLQAAADADKIEELQQQCQRLRTELQQQSNQLSADFRDAIFEQLQPLLTNFPTARQMVEARPDLLAKNLVSLFTPLENLLHSWGYEPIGKPWEQLPYNPQLHQPDVEDMVEGELVYIRFVGYRDGERILYPAKVSRNLPGGVILNRGD